MRMSWKTCVAVLVMLGIQWNRQVAKAEDPSLPIVAIFLMESRGSPLSADEIVALTDYLSTRLGESGKFQVIPREEIKKRLIAQKQDSFKENYDTKVQIELGRELSAAFSISSAISKVGTQCLITSSVWDLKRAIQIKAASERSVCNADKVIDAIDRISGKLSAAMSGQTIPQDLTQNAPITPQATENNVAANTQKPVAGKVSSKNLALPSDSFSSTESVSLKWFGTPGSSGDWVSVATKDMPENTYLTYMYTGGAKDGTFMLSNLDPGDYEARLYLNWPKGGYNVSDRLTFRVLEAGAIIASGLSVRSKNIGLSKSSFSVGEPVTVYWFETTGDKRDWVTVVPKGSSDDTAGTYDYLGGKQNGSYSVPDLEAGEYEARIYLNYRKVGYKVADRIPFSVR